MSSARAEFDKRLKKALDTPNLAVALDRVLPLRRKAKAKAFQSMDFDAISHDLHERKTRAIEQLPELISKFKEEAEKAGAVVHLAASVEDARKIIGDIARKNMVKLAVKSKSMATEEIDLNEYLEHHGVKVVETDLGEWIVQLAGEKPSHLITPALHKTREEVAELFSKVTGQKLPPDIPTLVAVARKTLRQSFIDADMGISGANIAIADTGTIVIVSNEGNARLTTTLPPIHVAVLGVEKIVPTLDDATAILNVLAKSGTGQKITTYVSFITGPSRTADIELSLSIGVHGPKEVHIILLDNGRQEMRNDPDFREALNCIRCGACLNACPSFQVVGGHVFGYKYTGPIGIMLTAFHHGREYAEGPQSLCLGCNACEVTCPVDIPLPKMILELRQQYAGDKVMSWAKRQALSLMTYEEKADKWMGLIKAVQKPFVRNESFLQLPFMADWRRLPKLPEKPFLVSRGGQAVEPREPALPSKVKGATVLYFPACITDNFYPQMAESSVQVLSALGARVVFPPRPTCCGLAHWNSGNVEEAKAKAEQTLGILGEVQADFIVSPSTSCTAAILQDYQRIFQGDPEMLVKARVLARKFRDFSTFVAEAGLPPGCLATAEQSEVTYHDSCQSCNCLKLGEQPRRIITDILGMRIKEMEESSVCCGFGGTFSIDYPEISKRILQKKLLHITETGAPIVVMDNPGCVMQIRGGLEAAGKPVRVLHLAELMAERLKAGHRL